MEEDTLNLQEKYHNRHVAHVVLFDYPVISRDVGHVSVSLTVEWHDLENEGYTKPRWDLNNG